MSDRSQDGSHSRRGIVKAGVATALAAPVALRVGHPRPTFAAGSDEIRVGLIGCGGRGTGATGEALSAGQGIRLVGMADVFKDRLARSLDGLNKKPELEGRIDVPPERQFLGLDAFEKLLAIPEINYVIIATPPGFKSGQIRAAIDAGKNVFTEKPMAVDGPTIRRCFEAAELAAKKGLAVGVGLQYFHHRAYLEMIQRVHDGMIGELVSGRAYWLQGGLWSKPRQKEWSDLEWQIRNWLYFTWLSGDHIVEQHIHNINVINWAFRKHPVAAIAVGGRQQRTDPAYGHIYDHFAVDFEYPDEVHAMSMCRQIMNTDHDVHEELVGTKGRASAGHSWTIKAGTKTWKFGKDEDEVKPTLQEHIDLIASIRKGKPNNELRAGTESNLAAIMGRMAAYTGKRVTWEQALNSKESLVPPHVSFNDKMIVPPVAIPGTSDVI